MKNFSPCNWHSPRFLWCNS